VGMKTFVLIPCQVADRLLYHFIHLFYISYHIMSIINSCPSLIYPCCMQLILSRLIHIGLRTQSMTVNCQYVCDVIPNSTNRNLSIVTMVRAAQQANWCSIPCWNKNFLFSTVLRPATGPSSGYVGLFAGGVNRLGLEADHSPPSVTEETKTSQPLYEAFNGTYYPAYFFLLCLFMTLKMEATRFPETSVDSYRTTWR
jgi:hypothetical protein